MARKKVSYEEVSAHGLAEFYAEAINHGWEVSETDFNKNIYFCINCDRNFPRAEKILEAWKILTPKRYRIVSIYQDKHFHCLQINIGNPNKYSQEIPIAMKGKIPW